MNFRPTKWKIIVSLIVAIILTIYLASRVEIGVGFYISSWTDYLPRSSLYAGLPSFILVYLIWSLLSKKNRK